MDIPQLIVLILIFAAAFTLVQAMSGLMTRAGARRKVNKRLAVAEKTSSLADLVVELRKQRGLDAAGDVGADADGGRRSARARA